MKFTKRYDWLYRGMIANLPADSLIRNNFTRWWNRLGDEVDKENLTKHNSQKNQSVTEEHYTHSNGILDEGKAD